MVSPHPVGIRRIIQPNMTFFQILILTIATCSGIGAAWMLRNKTHSEFLSILLSFSGAYLLGTVVLHLLPEIFHAQQGEHETGHDHITAIFILAGFFIQLIIVQFTKGLEHGHLHLHEHHNGGYVAGVVFGLSVHAFMEGIPLSNGLAGDIGHVFNAILIHKIPEAFALATVLFFSIRNNWLNIALLVAFVLMTPLGSFTGQLITENHMLTYNRLIAIVTGSLVHISTTIIFEASGKAHKISLYKFGAILVGSLIALAGVWLES